MSKLKTQLKTTSRYINLLQENGITTIKDFLQYFPRDYEDRTQLKNINELTPEENIITIQAKIIDKKLLPRRNKKIYEVTIQDQNLDKASIMYFGSGYQVKNIEKEQRYLITWKPKFLYGKRNFTHPELTKSNAPETWEQKEEYNFGRIYPIYSELQGIKPQRFAKKMRQALAEIDDIFQEYLPIDFLQKFNLLEIQETIKQSHYPDDLDLQKSAIQRIFFDRLLRIQLFSLINKQQYQQWRLSSTNQKIDRDIVKTLVSKLPFQLTNSQKKVTKTIIENLHSDQAMVRLLQGDVGSGKTIVATIAAYYTHKMFSWQTVFLAPLEVLATQHYKNLAKLLLPLGIHVELLTGSMTAKQKTTIKKRLAQGAIHIIIWTHAVIQEDIQFQNLQLAIVDEQHKFGVKQRSFFKKFGSPHILQMSATPIPRSMALAFFWEFSVSIINELPVGRKPIHTKIVSQKERLNLKPRILSKIQQGQKVFIVTPLIEESDKLENVQSALAEFEDIQNIYTEIKWQIWLLHGKIKPKEKEQIMQDFQDSKIKILVSTTVIEVGVDIPDATIMIIKNAERFGLSQLHQLRGRIWRSDLQSYCFLETKSKSSDSYKRLKAMENTNDGFQLAELDLTNRGAGEILGTRQSGETDIPLHILSNISFIEKVQTAAIRLLEKYPNLDEIPQLKKFLDTKIWNILV